MREIITKRRNEKIIYSDVIAEHTGEETSWTNATTSPTYNAKFDGRLIQLKLAFAQTTAASVIQTAMAKVSSASFGGREAIVMLNGAGLMTAPAFPTPIGILNCDLPVRTAQKLETQFRHQAGGITPVTVNMLLLGVFEG